MLDLVPSLHNNGIVVSAERVRAALARGPVRDAVVARDLRTEIEMYQPPRPALPRYAPQAKFKQQPQGFNRADRPRRAALSLSPQYLSQPYSQGARGYRLTLCWGICRIWPGPLSSVRTWAEIDDGSCVMGRELSQVDTSSLVAEVLHILSQGADGAASGAGGRAAETLITLLRERLGGTEDDRAALDAFLGNPGDAAGAAAVRAILDREVAADPDFGQRLEALAGAAAVQPPQTTTSSVVIGGGAKVSRNQISLGPLTINNNQQGRWSLGVLAVALMIVVALAGYGGVQVFTDGDEGARSGASGQGKSGQGKSGQGESEPSVPDSLPATQKTADAILPDRAAMEGTLFESEPDDTFPDGERGEFTFCDDYPDACGKRVRAGAGAGWAPNDAAEPTGWHAEFKVLAHASEDDAERTFDALETAIGSDRSSYGSERDPAAYTPPERAQLGDERACYSILYEGEDIGVMCMIRRGAYIGLISQERDGQAAVISSDMQTQLNTLLLHRMSEAWSGNTPDTKLRDIQGT